MALQAGKPLLGLPTHLVQIILSYRLVPQGLAWSTVRWREAAKLAGMAGSLMGKSSEPKSGAAQTARATLARRYCAYRPAQAVAQVLVRLGFEDGVPDRQNGDAICEGAMK